MDSFFITLQDKKQLTHDVYELIYTCDQEKNILPGQFLLCDTSRENTKLRRSYSVLGCSGNKLHFLIKSIENGKGGSKAICAQELGHIMQVWGPMGNFVLPASHRGKKIFIGTGTGFAPLYFQAKSMLANDPSTEIVFIFGVRKEEDIFYEDIFEEWSQKYPHFSYRLCLSKGKKREYFHGRVTDYIKNMSLLIQPGYLYSICGSPAMVGEIREILSDYKISKDSIFFEQY